MVSGRCPWARAGGGGGGGLRTVETRQPMAVRNEGNAEKTNRIRCGARPTPLLAA